jgi:hypothetical protein
MPRDEKQTMPQTPIGPLGQYAIQMDELRRDFMAAGFSRSEAVEFCKIHWQETVRVTIAMQAGGGNDSAE